MRDVQDTSRKKVIGRKRMRIARGFGYSEGVGLIWQLDNRKLGSWSGIHTYVANVREMRACVFSARSRVRLISGDPPRC